jgi:uncharacterized membrane protein YgdD (TMEM256/DUF423 family)
MQNNNGIAGTIGARVFFCIAALMMSAGIGMAALAAHAGAGHQIGTASTLLLANAPMLAAAAIALSLGFVRLTIGATGALVAVLGTILFASDMAHRGFGHGALFADAAPIGGSLDILGWLVVAIAAALGRARV